MATVARNTIMRMLDMSLSPEQKERDKEDKAILKEASGTENCIAFFAYVFRLQPRKRLLRQPPRLK